VQGTDTSAIQRLVDRARRRIRGQWALEGATTAAILAAAIALVGVFLLRADLVERWAGLGLLVAAAAVVVAGAAISAARRIDDELVARRIDRASNLADRLSTAIAFARTEPGADHAETAALMEAAIRDGVRAAPRADVALATPFTAPADLRAALGFLVVSALAAGLALPHADLTPRLIRVEPEHGAAGDDVVVRGQHLLAGVPHPIVPLPALPGALAGFVPADAGVDLGPDRAHLALVIDWRDDQIVVRVPAGAPLGVTTLTARLGARTLGILPFTVVDRADPAFHKAGSVALEPDDRAYLDALITELRAVAKRDQVPELEEFAKQIEQLLKDAELGKITKEQMLDALAKADAKLSEHAEPNQAELDKALGELGKQLEHSALTKPLGEALDKHDLDKARQELEKLADKLADKQLSDKDKQELAKQLEVAVQALDKKDAQDKAKADQQKRKLEDDVLRLEKKKDQAKTDKDKLTAEREFEKKKDELKRLEKDQQDKDDSAQRQALKRLTRDMQKAAENLDKPQKDKGDKKDGKDGKDQKDQNGQDERDRQASQKLKDAARETGKVDQDQRKQATQKKMSSQMDDLREAMRRAKQKGNKGPQDPFGRQGKNADFAQRARGGKGAGQAWKPGQGQPGPGGQKPGQGPGQAGQQPGQQQGGNEAGVGHDDNLTGDPTAKSGNTKDADLQGQQGQSGGGTRETILSAAQKGFATQRYRDVYGKYHQIVEEVMRTEKLPSSYKYYVKRYFAKIHPSTEAAPAPGAPPEDKTP
jgi:hypothetical protein